MSESTAPAQTYDVERMQALRAAGKNNQQIADEMGCSRTIVYRRIGAQPAETRANRKVESAPARDETAAAVEQMRTLREQGMSNPQIADAMGVTRQWVHRKLGPTPHELVRRGALTNTA